MDKNFNKFCWSCGYSQSIENYKKRKGKFRKYCNRCYSEYTKIERNNNVKNIIINFIKGL